MYSEIFKDERRFQKEFKLRLSEVGTKLWDYIPQEKLNYGILGAQQKSFWGHLNSAPGLCAR